MTRLGGHRVLASILLNMFFGGRCVKFVMIFYVFAVAYVSYLSRFADVFGEMMRVVDFTILG